MKPCRRLWGCVLLGIIVLSGGGLPRYAHAESVHEATEQSELSAFGKAAAQGDALAQWIVGSLYAEGREVRQNYQKAREWWEKSAAQGFAFAECALGCLYYNSHGVRQDYQKAREWWEKAAAQENVLAQWWLGNLYKDGYGVPQDYQKAREWYERAAGNGYAFAQADLGLLYEGGRGGPQNYEKAREWYEKAAVQGHAAAQTLLGLLYCDGKGIQQNFQKGREWLEKAAAQGESFAQGSLGYLYETGQGGQQDYEKARELYEKAAIQGESAAQVKLGLLYYDGRGVQQNYQKAKEWFGRACDNGFQQGCDAYKSLQLYESKPQVSSTRRSYPQTIQYRNWIAGVRQYNGNQVAVATTQDTHGNILSVSLFGNSGNLNSQIVISKQDVYNPVLNETRGVKVYIDNKFVDSVHATLSSGNGRLLFTLYDIPQQEAVKAFIAGRKVIFEVDNYEYFPMVFEFSLLGFTKSFEYMSFMMMKSR